MGAQGPEQQKRAKTLGNYHTYLASKEMTVIDMHQALSMLLLEYYVKCLLGNFSPFSDYTFFMLTQGN